MTMWSRGEARTAKHCLLPPAWFYDVGHQWQCMECGRGYQVCRPERFRTWRRDVTRDYLKDRPEWLRRMRRRHAIPDWVEPGPGEMRSFNRWLEGADE